MYYELCDRFVVAASLEKTWDFFSQAENLARITPPWVKIEIKTKGPIQIGQDAILDYTIRWAGFPIRWRTKIIEWSPPRQFIDLQIRGPYALWHHQHTFEATADGVECGDRVIYRLPGGSVGRLIHAISVRRQLEEIFNYRREIIAKELGWMRAVEANVVIRRL
jgi:ligand-binding SRPBCC domain-containing protein